MSVPAVLDQPIAFRVGSTGQTGELAVDLVFGVEGLGRPKRFSLDLSFVISAAEPNIYVFDRGDLQPCVLRAYDGAGVYPPLT